MVVSPLEDAVGDLRQSPGQMVFAVLCVDGDGPFGWLGLLGRSDQDGPVVRLVVAVGVGASF